jgi:hypothetical protein
MAARISRHYFLYFMLSAYSFTSFNVAFLLPA